MLATVRMSFSRARASIVRGLGKAGALSESREEAKRLQIETARFVAGVLSSQVADDNVSTEDASRLLLAYEQRASVLANARPSVTTTFKIADETDDIMRLAYQIELEQIQKMFELDRITRQEANRMRDNVQVMIMDLENKL